MVTPSKSLASTKGYSVEHVIDYYVIAKFFPIQSNSIEIHK